MIDKDTRSCYNKAPKSVWIFLERRIHFSPRTLSGAWRFWQKNKLPRQVCRRSLQESGAHQA